MTTDQQIYTEFFPCSCFCCLIVHEPVCTNCHTKWLPPEYYVQKNGYFTYHYYYQAAKRLF